MSNKSYNNSNKNAIKAIGVGSKLTTDQSKDELAIKLPIYNSTRPHKFGENADLMNI